MCGDCSGSRDHEWNTVKFWEDSHPGCTTDQELYLCSRPSMPRPAYGWIIIPEPATSSTVTVGTNKNSPPTLETMISSAAAEAPSRAQWERQKPRIIQYYLEENLSLKEVMGLMETRHGFVGATYGLPRRCFFPLSSRLFFTLGE